MVGGISSLSAYYNPYQMTGAAAAVRQGGQAQSVQRSGGVWAMRKTSSPESPVEPVRPVRAISGNEQSSAKLGIPVREGADPVEMSVRMRIRYDEPQPGSGGTSGVLRPSGNSEEPGVLRSAGDSGASGAARLIGNEEESETLRFVGNREESGAARLIGSEEESETLRFVGNREESGAARLIGSEEESETLRLPGSDRDSETVRLVGGAEKQDGGKLPGSPDEEAGDGEDAAGVESAQKAAKEGECQTCKERKYQDGSDDPGVSFKTPTNIDPSQAPSAVRGHEMEHVYREQAKARREGRKVVSQSVTYHTAICPECGRVYVSGGTTRTVTAAIPETQEEDRETRQGRGDRNSSFFAFA